MSSPISEQSLEWTYQFRASKYFAVDTMERLVFCFAAMLVSIPLMLLTGWYPHKVPPSAGLEWIDVRLVWIVFLVLLTGVLWLLGYLDTKSNRKLHVNRQMITLTDTNGFGTKERRMPAAGAKFRAVYLDMFGRLFAFDTYRANSAYHIEITRNGETFLFPCNDAREQLRILQQMTQLLKDNR